MQDFLKLDQQKKFKTEHDLQQKEIKLIKFPRRGGEMAQQLGVAAACLTVCCANHWEQSSLGEQRA